MTGNSRQDVPERFPREALPNEAILSFYNQSDRAEFMKQSQNAGATIIEIMAFRNAVRLRVKDLAQLRDLLSRGPIPVEWGFNFYVSVPNPEPWGKDPRSAVTDYTAFGNQVLKWLGVNEDNAKWGSGVTVAIVDTGVGDHPALTGSDILRVSLLSDEAQDTDVLGGWHGTAVASLIVAGSSSKVEGIAPAATVLSVRVMPDEGPGDVFSLARGIVEAVDRGAKVINISLAAHGDSFLLREAVAYAQQRGAVVVAASGNDAVEGVCYPARYDGVVAVTAVDADSRHVYFANRGPEIALAAPGIGLLAAWTNQSVGAFSGTSAAAPLVTGAIAALLSMDRTLTPASAAKLLREYADDAGAPGPDDEFGWGILNLERVLTRNVAGIMDAAAGDLYVRSGMTSSEDALVGIAVQNRGTVPLYCVHLDVVVGGIPSRWNFYNLRVGETDSHEFRLSRARLQQGPIPIAWVATIEGGSDARPDNNARNGTIYLATSGAEVRQGGGR